MEEKPNYYAVIPAEVRYANIKASAKLLYGEITALAQRTGECFATNSYFAMLYGCSEKQISIRVKELYDNGFITIRIAKEEGNKRYLAIHQKVGSYPPKGNDTTHQKVIHNNTRYNNTNNNKEIIKEKSKFFEKIQPVIDMKIAEGYEVSKLTEQAELCRMYYQEKKGIKIAVTTYNNRLNKSIQYGNIKKKKKGIPIATLDD